MGRLCFDCPRRCGLDRGVAKGFCKEDDKIRIAKIIENFMWEEPCISGDKGALAIFFSGCNLRCEFCQNYQISHLGKGEKYTAEQFRNLLESFDISKYSSIDLITPSHFSTLLHEALADFKSPIPIVWNSSGYENSEMIKKLADFVDVFLPDFKYYDRELSHNLSKAKDYFEVASRAILTMREVMPENIFNDEVLAKGVLIRHLVLPGQTNDSKKILEFISENISQPFVSIMGQFTPMGGKLQSRLKPLEYKIVLAHAEKLGLTNGYFQELGSANECFVPDF